MFFQPTIIALLLVAMLNAAMLAVASPYAWQLIRQWDIGSGSDRQLRLERLTYFFSTLLVFVCLLQIASTLLFVFNADHMHTMFVGAMCAIGTLNVNQWGFPALYLQLALFFMAALWLALNALDNRARDYPLVRVKYGALLVLAPVAFASLVVQLLYFGNLEADVITSCCGSMFSEESESVAATLAAIEPGPAMVLFYSVLLPTIFVSAWHWRSTGFSRLCAGAVGLASALAFLVSIAAVVAFVSLYIYEHPNHHCPFCILQPEFGYQGYLIYIPLFAAAAFGMASGLLAPFNRFSSLATLAPTASRRLAGQAAVGYALVVAVCTLMVLKSNLILLD
ncbi:MAG TPA: hypothetical protein PLN31_06480 [Azoarcus taiwanensis]|nr:hypothetical protein [Azoarcus taiwanensis]